MAGRIDVAPCGADGIVRVTISHPGKLNALSVAMWRGLRQAFNAFLSGLSATPAANLSTDGELSAPEGRRLPRTPRVLHHLPHCNVGYLFRK